MKKLTLTAFLLVAFYGLTAQAEVVFLPQSNESIGNQNSQPDEIDCAEAGYEYTPSSCEGAVVDKCPNGEYYKTCCPEGYLYTPDQCDSDISQDNCFGYYSCTPNEQAHSPAAASQQVSSAELCEAEGYTNPGPATCPRTGPRNPYTGCANIITIESCPYNAEYKKCVGHISCPESEDD